MNALFFILYFSDTGLFSNFNLKYTLTPIGSDSSPEVSSKGTTSSEVYSKMSSRMTIKFLERINKEVPKMIMVFLSLMWPIFY